MEKKLVTVTKRPPAVKKCCHHWMIDEMSAETSKGVCKFCGEQKYFSNYYQPPVSEQEKSERRREQRGTPRHSKETKAAENDILTQVERLFDMVSDVEEHQSPP